MNRSLPQSLLALLVIGGLVVVQQLFTLPGGSMFWRVVQDSLHAPWFFLVVVVLYWLFKGYPLAGRFLVVGGIAVVIALGTEFIQSFLPNRSASQSDLVRNAVGGVLGFIFATALMHSDQPLKDLEEKRLHAESYSRWGRLGPLRIFVALAALVALVVYTVWRPWQELELQRYRATLLPAVVDFADERSHHSIDINEGGLFRFGTGTALWSDYEGEQLLSLTFGDSEYPTLYLMEVMQAWAPYSQLVLDVFVMGDDPLPLTVGVRYEGSDGTSNYVEKILPAGANRWVIERNQLVPDGATGLRVRDVLIYTTSDHARRSVLLGRLFLQNL